MSLFLSKILNKIILYGGTPIIVGGSVRDNFLKLVPKDFDIEIFSIKNLDILSSILEEFGSVNFVGASFGILKLTTSEGEFDFSFPRLENKTSSGHCGFDVKIDSNLTFKDAAIRRDFTINSIGYNYKERLYIDPFNGIYDLNNKILKAIDKKTFIEDPLRVYRAVQFCARFDLKLDDETVELCKLIVKNDDFKTLSKERIFEEYKKLIFKSKKPSIGLNLLNDFNIEYFEDDKILNIDKMSYFHKNNIVLGFYFLSNILDKVSDDKKLKREISKLKTFKVPVIFEHMIHNADNCAEIVSLKYYMLNNMPKPNVTGDDLLKLGFIQGKKLGEELARLYEIQVYGR